MRLQMLALVTMLVLFTTLRLVQFHQGREEINSLAALQFLGESDDIASDIEHRASMMDEHDLDANPTQVRGLVKSYGQLLRNHNFLHDEHKQALRNCTSRACALLLLVNPFPMTLEGLEQSLLAPGRSPLQRKKDLRLLANFTNRYSDAMKDGTTSIFSEFRARRQFAVVFDIAAYFLLALALILQTLYIFRPAIRRLNESLATRSDFLSRISHEIRNPMNSILGMADILKSTKLNFEQQQYVNNLLRSGNALLDMLDNLIDFSVIENGRLQLHEQPFDLFHCLDRCLSLIAIQAHHKNLSVFLNLDPRIPPGLMGDRGRLDQVLINLLSNAVKFTEQGHVSLKVELINDPLAASEQVALRFTVADSGIGIPTAQLNEIFESFVQGDSSIRRKYGGSGLGLAISREILRLMDTRFEVRSELGKGSDFVFTILLKLQHPRSQSQDLMPLTQLAGRSLIFISEPMAKGYYQPILTTLGYDSHILSSASELRELLNNQPMMPASEVLIDDSIGIIAMINCRNLTEEQGLGEKSVALIRSNFAKENMDLLRRNGFTRFLIKPLKPWEMIGLPPKLLNEQLRQTGSAPQSLVSLLKERNLKVLLVDDSNDNLFLLKEVVNPVVGTVHFAENGLEALEKFRSNSYDVVFMDIQMPVMDGYTAIRKMRQMESERDSEREIPIYAVTAHAGLVDAQKCREAGFTDRVVKPVGRNEIYKSLSKAFALDHLDEDLEDDGLIPEKYLTKLMPVYFKSRFEDLSKLHDAISCMDFSALKALGHKIKGSAASYGFINISELSLRLERAASGKDLEVCASIVNQLESTIKEEHGRTQSVV
jgi:two-component system sensor histidine kinase/response regulator